MCAGSLGLFLESIWTKVQQAGGDMKLPMIAQVAGAAIATVLGQTAAAAIVGIKGIRRPPRLREMGRYARQIYGLGYPSIFMQSLYTVYIVALNVILAGFFDGAVIVLGLYYKLQTFFFIPLMGLETCIVPVLSYNYAAGSYDRCKRVMNDSLLLSAGLVVIGVLCFELIPDQLIGLFSHDREVLEAGRVAFRIIGASFIPGALSLMTPVFFPGD